MIAKRLAAVAAAVALIALALFVRDRIDDGGSTSGADASDVTTAPIATTTVVCATELEAVCDAIAGPDLAVRIEDAGITLDRLVDAAPGSADLDIAWVTLTPLDAAVALGRERSRRSDIELTTIPLATSPLALVTAPDESDGITGRCGDPIGWRCLGDADLSVGFARTADSAAGLLGATQAASGYSELGAAPFGDALFEIWLRDLLTSVRPAQLSAGTAIPSIQVRPSAMDVAAGFEAQLASGRRDGFDVLYAEPMNHTDAMVALPAGVTLPDSVVGTLRERLLAAGWQASSPAGSSPVDAATLLATRTFWSGL